MTPEHAVDRGPGMGEHGAQSMGAVARAPASPKDSVDVRRREGMGPSVRRGGAILEASQALFEEPLHPLGHGGPWTPRQRQRLKPESTPVREPAPPAAFCRAKLALARISGIFVDWPQLRARCGR